MKSDDDDTYEDDDENGHQDDDEDDDDDDGDVGDTPDVGDELGNALRVRFGLKLVALGFQEHFDVLRILQNFHFDIGLIDCNVSITKTSMGSSVMNRIPCSL